MQCGFPPRLTNDAVVHCSAVVFRFILSHHWDYLMTVLMPAASVLLGVAQVNAAHAASQMTCSTYTTYISCETEETVQSQILTALHKKGAWQGQRHCVSQRMLARSDTPTRRCLEAFQGASIVEPTEHLFQMENSMCRLPGSVS